MLCKMLYQMYVKSVSNFYMNKLFTLLYLLFFFPVIFIPPLFVFYFIILVHFFSIYPAKAKDKANLLETLEKDKDQTRQSCQTGDKQFKGLGVGKQQKRLLENIQQPYFA